LKLIKEGAGKLIQFKANGGNKMQSSSSMKKVSFGYSIGKASLI